MDVADPSSASNAGDSIVDEEEAAPMLLSSVDGISIPPSSSSISPAGDEASVTLGDALRGCCVSNGMKCPKRG